MNVRDHATLPTSLISYHRLEWDGADATGHGHTGTLGGTPANDYGQIQKCLKFNGTSQYVNIPAHVDYEVTSGITISCWVNWATGQGRKMVCKRNNTTIQWSVEGKPGSNLYQFLITIGGTLYTVEGSTPGMGVKWDHVVARYDGGDVSIWVNGVRVNHQAVTGTIDSYPTMPVLFAARCANGVVIPGADYFGGGIDDVGIWGRGLTDGEIGDLYQSGFGIIYGDLGQYESRKQGSERNSPYQGHRSSNIIPRAPVTTWQAHVSAATQAGAGAPQGLSPEISSIVVVNSTRIRVNFIYPATSNQALGTPGNYKITPTLGVYTVTPEGVANPTYVLLDIDEQEEGVLYQLDLQRIVRA